MAKLSEILSWISDERQLHEIAIRNVVASSQIEGIEVTPDSLRDYLNGRQRSSE